MQSMSRLSVILSLSILVLFLSVVHSSDIEKEHTSELAKCLDPTTLLIGHQCILNGKCTCSSQRCKSDSELCGHYKHSSYDDYGCTDVNGAYWPTSCCSDGKCYCTDSCDDFTCDDDSACPSSGLSDAAEWGIAIGVVMGLMIVFGCSCYRIRQYIHDKNQRVVNPQPVQDSQSIKYVASRHRAIPLPFGPTNPAVVNQERLPASVNIPIAYVS